MRSTQNFSRFDKSPKFIRRSMSPIDYINTQAYKERLKKTQIKFDFAYLNNKKLEKISTRKKDIIDFKWNQSSAKHIIVQQSQVTKIDESSFLKTCESGMDKISKKIIGQVTNDTNFFNILDDNSDIFNHETSTHDDLYNTKKRNFQLEQQLENKNRIIKELTESAKIQHLQQQKLLNSEKNIKNQMSKLQIKLIMEQRKYQQSINYIKKLKAMIRMEKDRNKENRYRLIQSERQFFQLSPDKYEDKY